MRTFKRSLLAVILGIAAAVCLIFGACGSDEVELKFETNGGNALDAMTVEVGEEVQLPTPEWAGHVFEGWYLNADLSGTSVSVYTAEEDATFYAKWSEKYKLTLSVGAGTLATRELYLDAGANLYQAVSGLEPTREGWKFGEWLNAGVALKETDTMPKSALTLTARYKVGYTIEVMKQNTAQNGYDKEVVSGTLYDYPAKNYTPVYELEGFEAVDHEGQIKTKDLTENPADNVYRLYYNRKTITLTLHSNYPGAADDETETITYLYGTEVELPYERFAIEGYMLIGWGRSIVGDPVYPSHIVERLLAGSENKGQQDVYNLNADTTLYALWVQGYHDLFGGNDYIYRFSETSQDVYLLRGGVLFKGTLDSDMQSFTFEKEVGGESEIVAQGKLTDDGTFCFMDNDVRPDLSFIYFKNLVGSNEKITIRLDAYNGITYVDGTNSDGQHLLNRESKGSYSIDESGLYHVSYTSGPKAGEECIYALSSTNSGTRIFMERDEVEYGWGEIHRGMVYNKSLSYITTSAYSITLNGFGNAVFVSSSGQSSSYYYTREENMITLKSSYGTDVLQAEVAAGEEDQPATYWVYSTQYEHTFNAKDESGAKLEPDGKYLATYTDKEGNATAGLYAVYSSTFGTLLQFFGSDGEEKLFLLTSETVQVDSADGEETQSVTNYFFTEKPVSYGEFNYSDGTQISSTYIIVINDDAEGQGTLYGRVGVNDYQKLFTGNIEQAASDSRSFTFTVTWSATETPLTGLPFDLANTAAFTFQIDTAVGSSGTSFTIALIGSVTTKEPQEEKPYTVHYTGEAGELTVYSSTASATDGYAIYEPKEGDIRSGRLVTDAATGITTLSDTRTGATVSFLLDADNNSFELFEGLLGSLYMIAENGSSDTNHILAFTFSEGKAGATYTEITPATDTAEEQRTEVTGTYARVKNTDGTDKTTEFGFYIYTFTPDSGTGGFTFIIATNGSVYRFAKQNATVYGEYQGDDGMLVLDGFSFMASFTETDGTEHYGYYSLGEGYAVLQSTDGNAYCFDLKEGKTFTLRDGYDGGYLLMDNQVAQGTIFTFDGYGKLTVRDITGEEPRIVDEDGVYKFDETGLFTLSYHDGATAHTISGRLGTVRSGSSTLYVFHRLQETIEATYVNNGDWSVLILDGCGNAERYLSDGSVERGTYQLISDDLLYFVNSDGDDATVYRYNTAKGTIEGLNYNQRGYYTEDFSSALLFTKYGFMIKDNTTRYYYMVDAQHNVHLYYFSPEDENAAPDEGATPEEKPTPNKYGFIEIAFGQFDNTKTFEGKDYLSSTSGNLQLTFDRKNGETTYPVPYSESQKGQITSLRFTPTGSATFSDSSARVMIQGMDTEIACTVERVVDEDQTSHLYVLIPSRDGTPGNYRLELEATYKGIEERSSFSVKSMTKELNMVSYTYLSMLLTYLMQGYMIPNVFGQITVTSTYDAQGNETASSATGVFGAISRLTDSKGELISFTDSAYTLDEDGLYEVVVDGTDGYKYHLYFAADGTFASFFGVYSYGIYAFTREQTITAGEYTIYTERLLVTEQRLTEGGFWKLTLKQGDTELEYDAGYILEGKIYYFVRTRAEAAEGETGKITSSTLYLIELTEQEEQIGTDSPDTPDVPDAPDAPTDPDSPEDTPEEPEAPEDTTPQYLPYASATVEKKELKVAYDAEDKAYVEYVEGEGVVVYSTGSVIYLFAQGTYDAATQTYTCNTGSRTYTFKVEGGVLTSAEVTQNEPTEPQA